MRKSICVLIAIMLIAVPILGGCSDNGKAIAEISLTDTPVSFEINAKNLIKEYIALRVRTAKIGERDAWDSKDALKESMDEIYARFSDLDAALALLQDAADSLSNVSGDTTFSTLSDNFSNTAYAAESSDKAREWAMEITNAFESYPTGKQLKGLAAYLSTDCKTALRKLEAAQGILSNEYENEAQMWDDLKDAATVIQATCKVELCVAGIATGNLESIADAGLTVINGADTLIAVGSAGAEVILGENSNLAVYMDMLKDAASPITSVTGLLTFSSTDTSTADRIAYLGDSINDLIFDGKIFGISLKNKKESQKLRGYVMNSADEAKEEGFVPEEGKEPMKLSADNPESFSESVLKRAEFYADISGISEVLSEIKESGASKDEMSEEEKKEEAEKFPEMVPDSISPDDVNGTYSCSMKMVQSGDENPDAGQYDIKVEGNKLYFTNLSSGKPVEFDYDPSSLTAHSEAMEGQAVTDMIFDGNGHFTYTMTNNNDGKVYVEITGTKIK